MQAALKEESEKLARSWMQHDAARLRDYLVADVEDPRLNVQSMFTRHFLVRELSGTQFNSLMEQECRFTAALNWLLHFLRRTGDRGELEFLLYGLQRNCDNVEGIEIPRFLLHQFSELSTGGELSISNYIEAFLRTAEIKEKRPVVPEECLDTFVNLWHQALSATLNANATDTATGSEPTRLLSVLEPACGSANDYRFLHRYGIAQRLNYTGIDLCFKNVENARNLFPQVRFELGNVFEIDSRDKAFDLLFVHDLFEHLSTQGLDTAVREVCRVTRQGLCVNFFNMDEIPEHVIQPVEEYHWNLLSMSRIKELFAGHGFTTRVLHVGTFLRQRTGCEYTHNPNAYTFLLKPEAG